MVKKCCVYGCTSSYASEKKKTGTHVPVYRFPKNEEDKERWIKAVPNANLCVSSNTVVCQLHWPYGFESISINGKSRPKNPPSVWPNIPASQIPTSAPTQRPTKRSSSHARNPDVDEISVFHDMDRLDFFSLKDTLLNQKRDFSVPFSCFLVDEFVCVQSYSNSNGVPYFTIRIYKNLNFEIFDLGVRSYHPALSKSRIVQITVWSVFEEIIRYVDQLPLNHKQKVMQEQRSAMCSRTVGTAVYNQEMIVRAFQYFAMSRCHYNQVAS